MNAENCSRMDDTSLTFLDDLLPRFENLPEECRKQT